MKRLLILWTVFFVSNLNADDLFVHIYNSDLEAVQTLLNENKIPKSQMQKYFDIAQERIGIRREMMSGYMLLTRVYVPNAKPYIFLALASGNLTYLAQLVVKGLNSNVPWSVYWGGVACIGALSAITGLFLAKEMDQKYDYLHNEYQKALIIKQLLYDYQGELKI